VAEPAQVRDLNRELASLVSPHSPALISIDQEGGRVQRVRATEWPAMRTVGNANMDTEKVAHALGTELRAMGFNLNFAPVADVDSNPANPVIGDRSFGSRASDVARHVIAWTKGQQAAGVIACAKHFPGHGDTDQDSHLELPRVEREGPDLEQLELVPFRAAVSAGVGSIMTAHVMFPAWDEEVPATMSERIIRGILRNKLGYHGVVFSDDLEMGAVRDRWTVHKQVRDATASTVDVFLCCRTPQLQLKVHEELIRCQESDQAQHQLTIDATRRVHALRERFLLGAGPPPDLSVVGQHAFKELAQLVNSRGMA